jgi:hypothetical protein
MKEVFYTYHTRLRPGLAPGLGMSFGYVYRAPNRITDEM